MSGKGNFDPENFPLMVKGNQVLTSAGKTLLTAESEADALEIARRLNENEDRREEGRWSA
jgi:D-alanine-D-alanine ligase-like ATP-grasp enzyme